MRAAILAVLWAAVMCNLSSAQTLPTPGAAEIRNIEMRIVMPGGARPMDEYDRYYAYHTVQGRQILVGEYVRRSSIHTASAGTPMEGMANVFVTTFRELPGIMDGGCSVVWVADVRRAANDPAPKVRGQCNGVA